MPSPFTVYNGSDATTLTDALLAPGSGITVSSIALKVSAQSAVNFYDGSLTPLGIGAGLLITSGYAPGTFNTVAWDGQDNSGSTGFYNGDADIDAVVNTVFATQSYDATTLSFDFTVADPDATSVSFDLVFGSDEFPEWVDQFVDCAIVMVNGVNYALFNHDPMHPLSVVSSNLAAGYFQDNAGNVLPIEYDGVSHVLKIVAPIKSGVNHIKIGIADTGDHIYDSGIFIANLSAGNIPGSGVVSTPPAGTDNSDSLTGSSQDEYFDLKGGDDTCYAGAGDDIVVAGSGNDLVYGGSGADQMKGDAGDDSFDGGDGADTAVFAGAWANGLGNYTFTSVAGGFTIADGSAGAASEGTDSLTNVEFAKFSDGLFALGAGGLTPVGDPGTPPSNTPGSVVISGIGAQGNELTATVSDPNGISGQVSFQWQVSDNGGSTWSDITGATLDKYTVSGTDFGKDIQVIASYVDNGSNAEAPVSASKAILDANGGDLVVTLMQLAAPVGASVVNPLTTLVQAAIDLGMSPNSAALAIKAVLGLPADVYLQNYDAYAVLQSNPADQTALAVEMVAVQVAILTSLSDDDTGVSLTLKILEAAAAGQTLDLASLADLSGILGIAPVVDPLTGKYPQPLDEIFDRNKTMADAIADGGDVNVIEAEWQDLLSIQGGINSTSIADLSIHVNQAPTGSATAGLANGLQGVAYTVDAATLLEGFSDSDGGTLEVGNLDADKGAVVDNGNGTFTITLDALYSGPVELTYQVVDGQGGATNASQMFVVVAAVTDHEATGTLGVTGTAAEGGTLLASLTGVSDADGSATIAYRWQEYAGGTWADIGGAATDTLAIPSDQSHVGKHVRVVATTTDAKGGTTAFEGAGQTIANVNDAPTGGVTIAGTPTKGATLTASNTLADADGLGPVGYQWQADAVAIAGATSSTLVLDSAQVGKVISVRASYTDGFGVVESATSAPTLAVIAGLTLTGTAGAETLTGGTGDDSLSGLGGGDTLDGLAGNDILDGGAGVDGMDGGDGSDLYLIGSATEHQAAEISDTGASGVDEVRFTATKAGTLTLYAADTGIERVVIGTGTGPEAVTTGTRALNVDAGLVTSALSIVGNAGTNVLTGTAFDDTLAGRAGNDTLVGGGGSDTLIGGPGTDMLTGGAGADRFVFDFVPGTKGNNGDTVTDFLTGTDKLQFSLSAFTGLGSIGDLASEQFWSGSGVTGGHDANDRIVYNTKTGALYYDADGSGAGAAVQVALIGTTSSSGAIVHPELGFADFGIIA